MKQNILHSAFTLIELLIVVSLMSLFFFFAIAAYNNFNRGQTLSTAVKEFKAVLRDAQNRAMSGEKDTTDCPNVLYGWQVDWSGNDYSISGLCTDIPTNTTFSTTSYKLPSSNDIEFSTSNTIIFKPVTGGIEPNIGLNVCVKSSVGISYKITILSGGEIKEEKYANNTCL